MDRIAAILATIEKFEKYVMAKAKNILFIMFDQLRWDYLSCSGHPDLKTPNIDWLASQGVCFTRAYIQSPICGSSRMSTYTGRYVHSHGASWNGIPLKVGELTMGEHLRSAHCTPLRYSIRPQRIKSIDKYGKIIAIKRRTHPKPP